MVCGTKNVHFVLLYRLVRKSSISMAIEIVGILIMLHRLQEIFRHLHSAT